MATTARDVYLRPSETQDPFSYIEQIRGGWISVPTEISMSAIPYERADDAQIVYVKDENKFYKAVKTFYSSELIRPDLQDPTTWYVEETLASLTWEHLPIGFPYSGSALITGSLGITGSLSVSGSIIDFTNAVGISGSEFSGSFVGDGSGLTGIASSLYLSGSSGQATISLKDDALLITGSSDGIIATVTNNTASFTISNEAVISGSFSGSFEGDGSGLTGIASSLYLSGSTGQATINLKDDVLLLTGSSASIEVEITNNTASFTISDTAVISGSFSGSFEGSISAAGTAGQVQFNSASLLAGATDFYYDWDNKRVGIGVESPTTKLDVHGDALITGSLTVEGIITAQEFHTEFVSASIVYESGSTKFGDTSDDIHSFSGSLRVSGSGDHYFTDGSVGIGNTSPTEKLTVAGNISASGDFYLDGALYDNNKDSGTLGQILQSTATGIDWVDPTGISVQAEQVFATVKNTSGTTLYKGTPVHAVSGSSSGNVNPVIAASASVASTMPATFILNEDLADEAEGLAISLGRITDVDTSAFNVGDIVYVGVNGGYTNVKPSGSANLIQNLGVVTKKHASNGAGYVYGSGRSNDVPNLPVGKIWVGSTGYSVTSSLLHLDETNERLGIGVNTPTEMLHVSGNVSASGLVYVPNIGTGEDNSVVILDSDGTLRTDEIDSRVWGSTLVDGSGVVNRVAYWSDANTLTSDADFFFNGTSVGIGTSSPSTRLEVVNSSPTSVYGGHLILQSSELYGGPDSGSRLIFNTYVSESARSVASVQGFKENSTVTDYDGYLSFSTRQNGSALAEKMRISSEGNVGINTTSPANTLDVAGNVYINSNYPSNAAANDLTIGKTTTGDHGITIVTANTNTGAIFFSDNDNNDAGSIRYQHGPNAMRFTTNRGERMRITSDGNVGIGTTSPARKLTVAGNASVVDNLSVLKEDTNNESTADSYIMLQSKGTLNNAVTSSEWYIQTIAENVFTKTGDSKFKIVKDHHNGAGNVLEALQIDSTGSLKLHNYGSGTFTGTATYTLRIDASGNVLEDPIGAGAVDGVAEAQQVTFWQDTDTISGSNDLTWDGTVLTINGTLEATEKSFVIDHPTQENKKLVYGVLEGPEHAVYCRGKISGEVIELPEEWTGLVDQDTITVQLTSIGKHQNLYVADIRDNRVFIKNGDLLSSKINAFYYIQGTRKDVKPLVIVRDK